MSSHPWWIPLNTTEHIEAEVFDEFDQPLVDKLDITIAIRRVADGWYLDFASNTFKGSGWTTRQEVMSQVDKTNSPGLYSYDFDTSSFPKAVYVMRVEQVPFGDWPDKLHGELKVGGLPDMIVDTKSDTTQLLVDVADVKADTTALLVNVSSIKGDTVQLLLDTTQILSDVSDVKADTLELLARLTVARAAALDLIPGIDDCTTLLKKISINKLHLSSGGASGELNWILYDDDGKTELLRWNVTDVNGDSILLRIATPARRSRAV